MPETEQRGGRRPRGEREKTKREIVEAATEVFAAHGYSNGSLQEVGEKVGMTHSGVLHHVGSKNALLLEVVRHRDRRDLDALDLTVVPEGAALFSHLMRTVRLNSERPGIVQAYVVLSADSVTDGHPAKPYFTDRFSKLRADIERALVAMRPESPPDAGVVQQAAIALIGAMDGIQVQWLLDPDGVDLVESTRFVMNAILGRALEPGPDRV